MEGKKRTSTFKIRIAWLWHYELTLYVPIIAILDIWKTTRVNEGESVVYDGFKYVWPVKG